MSHSLRTKEGAQGCLEELEVEKEGKDRDIFPTPITNESGLSSSSESVVVFGTWRLDLELDP
jgi:hypothetical protein